MLDRDCKFAGSFHVIDQAILNKTLVIAISSVPEYNVQAKSRGVKHVVLKEFNDLPQFAKAEAGQISKLLAYKQ